MRRRSILSWILSGALAVLVGAGVAGPTTGWAQDATGGANDPGFNPITKVAPGMSMLDVLGTMGPPSDTKGATYYYKARGRIVFEGNGSPGDKTKVLKVEPDKLENGNPDD